MNTTPTIRESLQQAQQKLDSVSDSSRLDAEILLSNALECTRTYLHTWPQYNLTFDQHSRFLKMILRRVQGEPVAYITGEREFWNLTLQVSPDTLIPRPETELLVEMALKLIPQNTHWCIADLGTGCGAIALAIASERPDCQVVATDISAAALDVARTNSKRLKIDNITFAEGNWLEPLGQQQFELIVSNPPYIRPDDPHLGQGDLPFEPPHALRSEPDGLADIKIIAESARKYLNSPGWLLLEHGYDQGSEVMEILKNLAYSSVSITKDMATHDRLAIAQWENET